MGRMWGCRSELCRRRRTITRCDHVERLIYFATMCIKISIDLPEDVEAEVRRQIQDLDGAAREAVLLELFRRGVLSHYDLTTALGIDRFETDALLKRKGIFEGSLTHEEVDEDVRNARKLLGL